MTIKHERQYRILDYLDGFREIIGPDGQTVSVAIDPEASLLPEQDGIEELEPSLS
jgi:hypothetical protein